LIISVAIAGVALFALSSPWAAAAVAALVAAGVLLYRRDKRRLEELLNVGSAAEPRRLQGMS
jgi:O-antigen ligase